MRQQSALGPSRSRSSARRPGWIETFQSSVALQFVKLGLGVALVDRLTTSDFASPDIVVRSFRPRMSWELSIIRPRDWPVSHLTGEFIGRIKDHFATLDLGGSP